MASIHELSSISIELLISFPQSDLDVDAFMELSLVMVVRGNRGVWLLQ